MHILTLTSRSNNQSPKVHKPRVSHVFLLYIHQCDALIGLYLCFTSDPPTRRLSKWPVAISTSWWGGHLVTGDAVEWRSDARGVLIRSTRLGSKGLPKLALVSSDILDFWSNYIGIPSSSPVNTCMVTSCSSPDPTLKSRTGRVDHVGKMGSPKPDRRTRAYYVYKSLCLHDIDYIPFNK